MCSLHVAYHKQLLRYSLVVLLMFCSFYYLTYQADKQNTSTLPSFTNNHCLYHSTYCKNKTSDTIDENAYYKSPFLHDRKGNKTLATETRGFIIVSHYSEQQIGAAMNLLTLCKWAKYVGALPVEPYVTESEFKLPSILSQSSLHIKLRFRDYFNITQWNKLSLDYGAAKLVSWDTFIKLKPKKFIFAITLYGSQKNNISKSFFIDHEIFEHSHCKMIYLKFTKGQHNKYLNNTLKLKMVRSVCIIHNSLMHIDKFSKLIYGNFKTSEVVVWLYNWQGINNFSRIKIYEENFHRTDDTMKMILTSNRILSDSKKYTEKFLKSQFGSYTAISFRSARRARFIDKHQHLTFFQNCLKQLQDIVNLLATTNASKHKLFLAQDLGKFGDAIADKYMSNDLMTTVTKILFQIVFNGTMTISQWEQSFVNFTNGITDSGYIATMQSTILKNSKCLIMFGGKSNFQKSVLYGYKQNHQNGETCIYEVCYK